VAVRQALDEVAAALESLTDEQREAIALRFFAGLSAREAAAVMGKQEGTVRGLQFRAIAAMRRTLGIDDPDMTAVERSFRATGEEPVGRPRIG
jgi:DNA-directed RNA polymerase specialized sigma24 family protein